MAALAGISLPDDASSKSKEAIARIKSYDFSEQLLPYIKLEDILQLKNDPTSNK